MNQTSNGRPAVESETIFLVRHATPDRKGPFLPYHIPPGPALSEAGHHEAHLAGEFLAGKQISQLFCSPLERCIGTARIIAEITGSQVEVLSQLIELQIPEDEEFVKDRMLAGFEVVRRSARGYPVALVSHGGPIGILLVALGMEPDVLAGWKTKFDTSNPLPPAGIWRAERQSPPQPWSLEMVFTPQTHQMRTG